MSANQVYLVVLIYDDGGDYNETISGIFSNEGLAMTYMTKLKVQHINSSTTTFRIDTMTVDENIDHEQVYYASYSAPVSLPDFQLEIAYSGIEAMMNELPETQVSTGFDRFGNEEVSILAFGWDEAQAVAAVRAALDDFQLQRRQHND